MVRHILILLNGYMQFNMGLEPDLPLTTSDTCLLILYRLVGMLIENLSVLKETCPAHSDLLTADRLGLPTHRLKLLVEPRPPAETGPEYHTLINLINLIAKRLASVCHHNLFFINV